MKIAQKKRSVSGCDQENLVGDNNILSEPLL